LLDHENSIVIKSPDGFIGNLNGFQWFGWALSTLKFTGDGDEKNNYSVLLVGAPGYTLIKQEQGSLYGFLINAKDLSVSSLFDRKGSKDFSAFGSSLAVSMRLPEEKSVASSVRRGYLAVSSPSVGHRFRDNSSAKGWERGSISIYNLSIDKKGMLF
jgi:hypothetical protein